MLDAGIKAAGGLEALREIRDLSREATGTGLVVEAIAPGHGRLGTLADLTAALAVKPPSN